MQGGALPILIAGALVLFVLFRRARALLTRQKIRPQMMALRLALFAILAAVILALSLANPPALIGDVAGLAAGAAIAGLGLRLTTFDRQPDGLYYTPNRYVGLAVLALFLLRFVYRLAIQTSATGAVSGGASVASRAAVLSQLTADPLTTGVFFLLVGYYAFYYVMLILRARQPAPLP
jgi:hypothetical protein